jgi:hypothetical protein
MRAFAALLSAAAIIFGAYYFYMRKMPVTDQGTAPTQAINLTAVRMDLLQIATAERTFMALNGHCASLEELISSNSLNMSRPEREGYTYIAECGSGADFTITARHAPAPAGPPIRYPTLAVDQNQEIREIE